MHHSNGLLAIAFAELLCARRDPVEYTFDKKQMRTHQLCFEREQILNFPMSTRPHHYTRKVQLLQVTMDQGAWCSMREDRHAAGELIFYQF